MLCKEFSLQKLQICLHMNCKLEELFSCLYQKVSSGAYTESNILHKIPSPGFPRDNYPFKNMVKGVSTVVQSVKHLPAGWGHCRGSGAALARIQSLAQEHPYAIGVAIKKIFFTAI